jgi:hypothetical protein
MAHLLKNKNLELHFDLPNENYNASRFDWTGKITQVKFQNRPLSIAERNDIVNDVALGKGFYNEFGIDTALGFEQATIGGWFHKIGVGLLQKDAEEYLFYKAYKIRPAKFQVRPAPNKIIISCTSDAINGYAYVLKKEIALQESGFSIDYQLVNTGEKVIRTDEYVHNFMALNNALMESDYELKFPFQLRPERFKETVNSEQQVALGSNSVGFNGTPKEQFFFSNLSGGESVEASWELVNHRHKLGMSETGNFKTSKVNLWGWKHVISPELFFQIFIPPGESTEWSRTYKVFNID